MRRIVFAACVLMLATGSAAHAVYGANDDVPGATLLLPYFEVDLDGPDCITTLFSINNASATAVVAHVTLWTDESVPTLDFDIYLTGFDVQTINLLDIFNGVLPVTADDGADPGDTANPNDGISNQGSLSQDINFPGSSGPCVAPAYPAGLTPALIAHIRALHTGGESGIYDACGGFDHGDNIARGYVTVDTVNQCNLQFPADANYFTAIATRQNVLWGDYFYVDPVENFAQGETLLALEALPSVSTLPTILPSFYERYNPVAGEDFREPLPSVFAVRYAEGGGFDAGTDLIIWREAKIASNLTGFDCGDQADWFPLTQDDVVGFDERENPEDLCVVTSDVSPPPVDQPTCFPLEAGRYGVRTGSAAGTPIAPTADFGWLFLNLDYTFTELPEPGYPAQAWVTAVWSAQGRFSVGFDAYHLGPGFATILIP